MGTATISTKEYIYLLEQSRLYNLAKQGDLIKIKFVQTNGTYDFEKIISSDELQENIEYINKISFEKLQAALIRIRELEEQLANKSIFSWR